MPRGFGKGWWVTWGWGLGTASNSWGGKELEVGLNGFTGKSTVVY